MPEATATALKRSLNRETRKGNILSVYKGYYVIIPPKYKSRGMLPTAQFIDGLMHYMERRYYVGLLSAAAWYGAAHQQPQEFFVITELPALRNTQKKGIKINYVSRKRFPENYLMQKNTETGQVTLSHPLLTAIDLIQFDKRVGGINRAASIIAELMEQIKRRDISETVLHFAPVTVLQRLGYLLEFHTGHTGMAGHLFDLLNKKDIPLYRTPLKTNVPGNGSIVENRWKVIENTELEME